MRSVQERRTTAALGLAACLLVPSGTAVAFGSDVNSGRCPVVERTASGFDLRLPTAFARALNDSVPNFRPWTLADYWDGIPTGYEFTMRQAPWAVVGDFNGDGWCDLVIEGHDESRAYRLVVWGGERPSARVFSAGDLPREKLGSVLQYYGPGRIWTNFSDDSMELFTDGFNVYAWEKAGLLYYWKDDHFEQFFTSD